MLGTSTPPSRAQTIPPPAFFVKYCPSSSPSFVDEIDIVVQNILPTSTSYWPFLPFYKIDGYDGVLATVSDEKYTGFLSIALITWLKSTYMTKVARGIV
ncbi:uncharacterized protein LACBIDRAFT_296500 [Laccaria bicolor S238N-H82]|uniref:Predicted protein n=1 Tax=Laccaria bicolor (strain S238N-H82 / ATCC MYA-4686) TaxID=486041 RepID=B0D8Z2_LACBS|nr:uncharacterized protein LACBIDRAFT_296499 [Laccaria bicolor S238N-H82]XP_001880475.1 uncharacterized protein LACBIDRAFT_296500 [Laccaria bicolor S238N-H82]EDR09161.1 predicted protein [Laccaria bicolor S238N-H82]EDR09162.1 predicted protein [Laccaria bicolor S238N-H82]|eukprot:XP_001880474.1 predicted protein [Laccaria bicolor S238N-H82]